MMDSLKEHFDAKFEKGKWYFKLPSDVSWFAVIFAALWGGGFAGSGTFVLLIKLGVVNTSFSESPAGIGWVIGPLFATLGYTALLIGLSQFARNRLELSKTSIKVKRNFIFFQWRKFGISRTNLKYLQIVGGGLNYKYRLLVTEPSGKVHVAASSKSKPDLENLASFIEEYMDFSRD